MQKLINWIRRKTILAIAGLVTVFGTITTRLVTCTQQTTIALTQVATNPSNQVAVVEGVSFVANLFYEGPDDPFATPGAGGELGKISKTVLHKGVDELFAPVLSKIKSKSSIILETSRIWKSSQIQEGARAIHKKIGHAEAGNYKSTFSGITHNQENAEKLISDIIENADFIVVREKYIRLYNSKGQGLNILRNEAEFKGFLERMFEK